MFLGKPIFMKIIIQTPPAEEYLIAELAKEIEAYDRSLNADESMRSRELIALRIVEIEKKLVSLKSAALFPYFS